MDLAGGFGRLAVLSAPGDRPCPHVWLDRRVGRHWLDGGRWATHRPARQRLVDLLGLGLVDGGCDQFSIGHLAVFGFGACTCAVGEPTLQRRCVWQFAPTQPVCFIDQHRLGCAVVLGGQRTRHLDEKVNLSLGCRPEFGFVVRGGGVFYVAHGRAAMDAFAWLIAAVAEPATQGGATNVCSPLAAQCGGAFGRVAGFGADASLGLVGHGRVGCQFGVARGRTSPELRHVRQPPCAVV